jgi:RecA/RadA recombinase
MHQAPVPITDDDVKQKVILHQANNLDEYQRVFMNFDQRVNVENIRLIVIDNIHTVCDNFMKADGTVDYIERYNFLLKQSRDLKRLAYKFNLVVVILNNVVADVNHDGAQKGFFENRSRGQSIVPSLGMLWSNCINERIALKRKGTAVDCKRTIAVEKSSYMRKNEVDFEILNCGIRGKV